MNLPFKIIRGDQYEAQPPPNKFVSFDIKRAKIERIKSQFLAMRDKAILLERHKAKSK